MDHSQIFLSSKRKVYFITGFLVILGLLSVLGAALYNNPVLLAINIIKTAILFYAGFSLLSGQKWAIRLITFVAAVSILQGFTSLVGNSDTTIIIVYTIMVVGFIAIIWYLNSSKEFDAYINLTKNGARLSKEKFKSFDSIIYGKQVVIIKHKNFSKPENYIDLSNRLIDAADVKNQFEEVHAKGNRIYLETKEVEYEISYNDRLNILDRSFINKFNTILAKVTPGHIFYYVYPDNILNPDEESVHLAYLDRVTRDTLRLNAYLK